MRDAALALVAAFALYLAWPPESLLLTPEPGRFGLARWRLVHAERQSREDRDADDWVATIRSARGLVPGSVAAGRPRRPAGAHRKLPVPVPLPVRTYPQTLPPPAPPGRLDDPEPVTASPEGHPPWDTAARPAVTGETMIARPSGLPDPLIPEPLPEEPPTLVRRVRGAIEDDLGPWLESLPRLDPGE